MKKSIEVFIVILLFCFQGSVWAHDGAGIPWQEVKILYQESIKRKLHDGNDKEPFVYAIDTAHYTIKITPENCFGKLTLKGSSITGKIAPIPIFKNKIILTEIHEVSGGSLVCSQGKTEGISFLPNAEGPFQIKVSFFVPIMEDNRSQIVSMEVPRALKNSLSLELSEETRLLESPGVTDASGIYHFAMQSTLSLRFSNTKDIKNGPASLAGEMLKHHKTVETPPTVLDTISYFTALEENGTILSVLVMTVPPEAGPYIKIQTLKNTEIWSLKINNKRKKVYIDDDDTAHWMIPLANKGESTIELALIRQGDKVGLRGRLEVIVPGMELPSRKINIGVSLPERVDLISYEGPVTPSTNNMKNTPREFMGKPYYFSRAFYKGQGMRLAVLYKEPVGQSIKK